MRMGMAMLAVSFAALSIEPSYGDNLGPWHYTGIPGAQGACLEITALTADPYWPAGSPHGQCWIAQGFLNI